MIAHTILYVANQKRATEFYQFVLGEDPILNVPGMTEFQLSPEHILGLMPEAGIVRLLGDALPDPARAAGIPRAELYLRIPDPEAMFLRAKSKGGKELSPILERNWGERAGYLLDLDGHVLALSS